MYMPHYEPPFVFGSQHDYLTANDFVLSLPRGIQDKKTLLSQYSRAGRFPEYFGNNWDALTDCLRDFSWIKQSRILIVHDDLPLADNEKELLTYIKILDTAVKLWKKGGQHKLVIVFPQEVEANVARLI